MTATAIAPTKTEAPTKPQMAKPMRQPALDLPWEEFREKEQAHTDWVLNGMPCQSCGEQLVRGYDGPRDRSYTHLFNDGRSPDNRCHPELYR